MSFISQCGSRISARLCCIAGCLLLGGITRAAEQQILATRVAAGLERPLYVTTPAGDTSRLFVVEQHTGRIRILDLLGGEMLPDPFLTITDLTRGNEQGLLGLAFAPDYATSGHFYVNFTDRSGATNVRRYQVSGDPNRADAASAQTLLRFSQPQSNHNGGWIGFGPRDGYLYVASGDGGGSNDSGTGHTANTGNAQDITDNLLGKILRIDVGVDAFPDDPLRNYAIPATNPFLNVTGDDEIWAYGLRNPWRSSFDRQTGDFYIADVGQGAREEINFQAADGPGGVNYGWRLREGTIAAPGVGGARPAGAVDPIYDYPHDSSDLGGFSVSGGYVYRGPLQELQGHYFFGDFVSNNVWSLRYNGQSASDFQRRTDQIRPDVGSLQGIASFGEDAAGNMYVVSLDGDVFRFDDVLDLEPLVAAGSRWNFLDDGSDLGTNWRGADFDDSAWQSGLAQLGYGEGDEATAVSFGGDPSNRHVTTYFRHTFSVANAAEFAELHLELLRDDGAAVYLNGAEIARTSNLAPDATAASLADFAGASAVSGADEDRFFPFDVPADLLLAGRNVLAVELHQHSRSSDDLSFDLQLSAVRGVLGDFDRDQDLDAADIDLLSAQVRAGGQASRYDVNADRQVDDDDRIAWVRDLKQTWSGDANLDGLFDDDDLVEVFQFGQYEDLLALNSQWSSGDWTGDGEFDSADLVAAFQDGGYLVGPRVPPPAIPEPHGLLLGCLALAALCTTNVRNRGLSAREAQE